jgi:hypothetical protein
MQVHAQTVQKNTSLHNQAVTALDVNYSIAKAAVPLTVNQVDQAAPKITTMSTFSGAVGTQVTITGVNFGSTPDTVIFNGTTATIKSWSGTSIVTVVPAGATTGNVVVMAGVLASNGVAFTVPGTTLVTSLNPSSGYAGLVVNISGSGFGAAEGQSTVTFNGALAGVLNWSDTSITAIVPGGATTGPVVVKVVTLGQTSNSNVIFTISTSSCTY